jgi:acetyl esterase/lipase
MALRLDVEIVQLQPPYHGRRTPRGSRFGGELYWTADMVRSLEALRQNVLDARTLLAWLLREDPRPVGLSGLSLGGALALLLTCLDRRFAFSIPLIAHMDLAALMADAPVLARTRAELRAFGWTDEDFRRFVSDIGWYRLRPKLPRQRIHLFAAADDRFFDPAVVEAMWRRWGRPPIHWYPCSHMGFIARLPEALRVMRAVVDRHETGRGT